MRPHELRLAPRTPHGSALLLSVAACCGHRGSPAARRRVEHWRQIVVASCEQCGRNRLPVVHAPCELGDWLTRTTPDSHTGSRLLLAPSATAALGQFVPTASTEILIGPEGGLSPEEERAALAAGFRAVRLGPRILRMETAGPAMLAAMNALWGVCR